MKSQSLAANYISKMASVHGWLAKLPALQIAHLLAYQTKNGLRGNTGEIGVHHGKLFILLLLMTEKHETCLGIDLFDNQDENIDRSGMGNLSILKKNIGIFTRQENFVLKSMNSLDIKPEELVHELGQFRFFSVDGGHTTDLTFSDLANVEQFSSPHGIIVLDDVMNDAWIEVVTGFTRYLNQGGKFVPFAYCQNKLFLCKDDYVPTYKAALLQNFAPLIHEYDQNFFGYKIDNYRYSARNDPTALQFYLFHTYKKFRKIIRGY